MKVVFDVDAFTAAFAFEPASRAALLRAVDREPKPLCSPELMEVYATALEKLALRRTVNLDPGEARMIAYSMAHDITPVDIDAFAVVLADDQELATVVATARSGGATVVVTQRPEAVTHALGSFNLPSTQRIEAIAPDEYLRRVEP